MKCKKEDLVYKSDVLQIVQVDKKELWERRSLQEIYKKKLRELQPITETEIRNKAIDEFYDKALNFEDYIEPIDTSENGAILLYSGKDITNVIVKIKEELKGARE